MDTKIQNALNETMRATRLGTCYDDVRKELITNQNSFDLAKLNYEKLILFIDGTANFEMSANSNNNSSANSTAYGLAGKAEGGLFGTKLAASFNMEQLQSDSQKSFDLEADFSYRYSDQVFQIQSSGLSENIYYNCLLDHCRDALDKVLNAKSAIEKFKYFQQFIKTYGSGCVTKLNLGSGSIAKVQIASKGTADSQSTKYGASLGLSTLTTSISTAVSWAKERKASGLTGSLHITGTSYPQNTPTRAWLDKFIETFSNKGLEALTEPANFAALPASPASIPPPYPNAIPPKTKEIPKNDMNISEEMKKTIMKEEDFPGTWSEFEEHQAEAIRKINKNDIVKSSNKLDKSKRVDISDIISKTNTLITRTTTDTSDSGWDLGGYIPVNFETKSWIEIFPSLKASTQYVSTTNINFAKIVTFYYTRLQFGQYMIFLKETGEAYSSDGKQFLESDITAYFDLCDNYLSAFFNQESDVISDSDFTLWLRKFEDSLNELVEKDKFYNERIYNAFFQNFETFSKCPFGFFIEGWQRKDSNNFIPNKEFIVYGGAYDQLWPDPDRGFYVSLKEATRAYPVIQEIKGETSIGFVYYNDFLEQKTPKFDSLEKATLSYANSSIDEPRIQSLGLKKVSDFDVVDGKLANDYKDLDNKDTFTLSNLKCIGFEDVSGNTVIRGATPMFQNFPFSFLSEGFLK